MTDLERFFRRLVANLAASDPARLHHPIPLEDVQDSIIPYRSNRRALLLESSEDYEMVLLRLCAGEGDLVRTEPEEARVMFAEELRSPNPDLSVLRRVEHVLVSLRSEPLARALDPEPHPDAPFAPPSLVSPPAPPIPGLDLPELHAVDSLDTVEEDTIADEPVDAAPYCLYCGDRLPSDRPVRFCPHCGQRQAPPECPQCHSEIEPGWRHCVSCGAPVQS